MLNAGESRQHHPRAPEIQDPPGGSPRAIQGAFFPSLYVAQNIALHAVPTDRASLYLVSTFPDHSTFFLLSSFFPDHSTSFPPNFSVPQPWTVMNGK